MASSLTGNTSATLATDETTSSLTSSPLADPIAAHPPALALAPPVQLGEPLRGSDPGSTDTTDLSASTSSKPVRPPRAAQRPSTASRRTSTSGTESITGTNPAAITSGSVVPTEANASEGTTLVGTGGADSAVPEMSSVEKVDDAAAKAAIDESAGPSIPTAESAALTGSHADKRPSTISQTIVADDSTTSTPKIGGAVAQSASTSANNNLNTTAASPRSPSAAAAGTASTSRPRTTQPSTSSASAKKRKGGFSLLTCLPCFGSTGHEEDPPQQSAAPARRASPTPRVNEVEKDQDKATTPARNDVPLSPAAEPVAVANDSPVAVENEKVVPAEGSSPQAVITSPMVEPASAVVASNDDAVSQPPPTAPTAHSGVVLPADETEGVTSGAVVPPGQVAASQVPHPPTPASRQRRRRAKQQQQQQARSGTEGIITSVPEPGAVGGGILLAPRHDETTSSEISTDEEDEDDLDESEEEEEEEDEEQMLIARGGVGIPIGEDGLPHPLLDELSTDLHGRKCLVLDLDETLVHSSFKMVHQADFVVPVEIENQFHNVYVIKRPGVDAFLKAMGEIYEVVVFTASLSKYADPVLDHLDIHRVVKHRLFRESCYNNKGNYVKDLSQLGRPISECIIIDNSPASYVFHPNNAVPISSWFNDPHDTELTDLIPFLADLSSVEDIRSVLDANLYLPSMITDGAAIGGAGETDGISTALQQL